MLAKAGRQQAGRQAMGGVRRRTSTPSSLTSLLSASTLRLSSAFRQLPSSTSFTCLNSPAARQTVRQTVRQGGSQEAGVQRHSSTLQPSQLIQWTSVCGRTPPDLMSLAKARICRGWSFSGRNWPTERMTGSRLPRGKACSRQANKEDQCCLYGIITGGAPAAGDERGEDGDEGGG